MRACRSVLRDTYNATTTMECWSPDELPNLSFSHIWSSSPSFVIPWFLAGIQPLAPGWKTVSIKPQPGPLTSFSFSMPTIRGRLHVNTSITRLAASRLNYSDGALEIGNNARMTHFQVTVTIPGNTNALVHLPIPPADRIVQRQANNGATDTQTVFPCVRLNDHEVLGSLSPQGQHLFVTVDAGTHTVEWCTEK